MCATLRNLRDFKFFYIANIKFFFLFFVFIFFAIFGHILVILVSVPLSADKRTITLNYEQVKEAPPMN